MKKKVWFIGSVVAASCFLFTACGEKDDKSVTGIVVTADKAVNALEVGDEAVLTAAITPAGATEAIKWVSEESDFVSVVGSGTTATIKALKPVALAKVYATNQAGTVVSNKIDVTVKPEDYAKQVVGNYSGTGEVKAAAPFGQPLTGVLIKIENVGNEVAEVKMTFNLTVNMGMEVPLTIVANEVLLSPGTEAGILTFEGVTEDIVELQGLWLNFTGSTFNTATGTLSLKLNDGHAEEKGDAAINIELTATKVP